MKTFKEQQGIREDGHTPDESVSNALTELKRNIAILEKNKPAEYPQWWVNKIVKAADYIDSAADFIQNKNESVKEAPMVSGTMDIVRSILSKIESDITKDYTKGKFEKHFPTVKMLAKIAGYGITQKKQAKGKTFRYDLKK